MPKFIPEIVNLQCQYFRWNFAAKNVQRRAALVPNIDKNKNKQG